MSSLLESYAAITGPDVVDHLRQLAESLRGAKVVHVNSTRVGGGVAEILEKLIPLSNELGLDTSWEVISGGEEFYQCTKSMHNGLQGNRVHIAAPLLAAYEEANSANAEILREKLSEADFVFIHDPQPAGLLDHCPDRRGKWVWRCHIDASHPYRPVWKYLRKMVDKYEASIFSLPAFAQPLQHPQYIIPPSIDPLSAKNIELPQEEVERVRAEFALDPARPLLAPDSHRTINALQRAADIVLQKSTREGFGLTVTEAMWKSKPVIGGDTGGIRLQVINYQTGFLVHTSEGAALRIRYLLRQKKHMQAMGSKGKEYVRENFLLTRHLREYLTLMVGLRHQEEYRIELS